MNIQAGRAYRPATALKTLSNMKNSSIQWTDDTVNPVMGCDGCELWPTLPQIVSRMTELLNFSTGYTVPNMGALVARIATQNAGAPLKDLIPAVVLELAGTSPTPLTPAQADAVIFETKAIRRCYAGVITERFGERNPGYPPRFDLPSPMPGRMNKAASASDLRGTSRPQKPWLEGLPRLIFVSDMGDALSASISFEYLRDEVIETVRSEKGHRHLWQWLSKRPNRMAQFATWLSDQGIAWPENLMAMTSVTSQQTVGRVHQLQRVGSRMRGLSVEPLWGPVTLPLDGIDWVIVGGESGYRAETLDLSWVRDLRDQCRRAGVAFFVKQLGRRPRENGILLELEDGHGGNWEEWPPDLRIREMPNAFRSVIDVG